jgi:hypothetical protein
VRRFLLGNLIRDTTRISANYELNRRGVNGPEMKAAQALLDRKNLGTTLIEDLDRNSFR